MKSGKKTFVGIVAGIAILLLIVFVIMSVVPPERTGTVPSRPAQPEASQMRADGRLAFIDENGTQVTTITIEIAESEQERTQGLMGRTRIGENEGMFFIFPGEELRSFWMANTPLPLDILFVNAANRIVMIHRHTKPYSEESLPSNSPAQFVVEVNAGFCDKYGIIEGHTIKWNRN
jgi:uncharacterized membrane protein (UPF0127 family)